jgi:hypothetical protein
MSDVKTLSVRFNQLAHEFGVLTFKADRVKAEMLRINAVLAQLEAQEREAAAKEAAAEATGE